MLYKVTPVMPNEAPKPKRVVEASAEPGTSSGKRKKRKATVYDADGNEVLITMMCLKCRSMKPLTMFGLRKMGDGAIRNQPWCRTCRSSAGSTKKVDEAGASTVANADGASLANAPAENAEPRDDVAAVEPAPLS